MSEDDGSDEDLSDEVDGVSGVRDVFLLMLQL